MVRKFGKLARPNYWYIVPAEWAADRRRLGERAEVVTRLTPRADDGDGDGEGHGRVPRAARVEIPATIVEFQVGFKDVRSRTGPIYFKPRESATRSLRSRARTPRGNR